MGVNVKGDRQRRIIVIAVIGVVLVCVLLIVLDWSKARELAGEADWELTLVALLFTAISYFCLSYGFVTVNRVFGIGMAWRELFEIGFVSTALANVTGLGGAAGHSLRLVVMQRRGVTSGNILAASIFHSYLYGVAMFSLLPLGLIYLIVSHTLSEGVATGLRFATGMLVLAIIVATVIVFVRPIRSVVLRILNKIWHLFKHRSSISFLSDLDVTLTLGAATIRSRPLALALPLGLMVANWVFTVVSLWFCFDAIGNPLGLGILVTGFAIGISAGALSMVPGGFGVQEASMAGMYALFGVSFTQAFLAAVLFRIVSDFIPFVVSLGFYRRVMRGPGQASIAADNNKHMV
jgi:uncharacterized protein (TIRG00374 family)